MKFLHLQGIRGLAIISVTLFHFFPKQFSNGYLGVDIFFALSGFLMTMMLNKYEKIGSCEILEFFYRRVKRIVPLYYLCTLFTLFTLQYLSVSVKEANVLSSINAVAFITNIIQQDNIHGYFEKLGVAVDLFTHTWSLSLEMQFYLLFPVIYILNRQLPTKRLPNIFLGVITVGSFFFYCYSDKFTSFNSVFSRIWQFNAGMFVYTLSHPSKQSAADSECAKFIEQKPVPENFHCWGSSSLYALVSLIALMVSPETVYNHFGRVIAIVATMELFHNGGGCPLLENTFLVFIGEISYSWYLVHWPFAAYCRLLGISQLSELLAVYLLTLFLSIILHYAFERIYLKWSMKSIALLVSFLLASNFFGIFSLNESIPKAVIFKNGTGTINNTMDVVSEGQPFNWPSDFMNTWKGGYEEMSAEQRIKINEWNMINDERTSMLRDGFCKKFEVPINPRELRCVFTEGLNPKSPLKLLAIGSSYAGNLFPLIFDECKANFSRMEASYTIGCEVLGKTLTDIKDECILDWFYLEAVKQVQPDVLFIVQRHMVTRRIIDGNGPFDDWVFKVASERLAEIQKHVKRRIFILDDFPETSAALDFSNRLLKKGATVIPELNHQNFGNTIARMRMHRLASECEKCRLFDYTPQFFFNGSFRSYDPKYFVGFTTQGMHLSREGKERVRPVIKHLCRTF